MSKGNWIDTNTFHHTDFHDLKKLVEAKHKKNLKISLCFPTLNEEKTVAKEIVIMKSELMLRHPLLDQIIVIDSGSEDKTREIAADYGAEVYLASDILPNLAPHKGKGENLWKALYVASGDIIVYIDADIKNIHHRFVYDLVGPLIAKNSIKFSKAFYDRPIAVGNSSIRPTGGGRVTELVIRPFFSLFFPELAQIMQPLSGEYAGYREIFENIPFPIGYGVETSMLLDIYKKWGLEVMAQVDLDRRVHRNQDTMSLGRMSFGIMQTFLNRLQSMDLAKIKLDFASKQMIQYSQVEKEYRPEKYDITQFERRAIIEIDEYLEKFHPDRRGKSTGKKRSSS